MRPVCILSVGRSGTSLAGRALEAMGIDFGPADGMLAATEWNRQGFWEQRAIMELNDEILAELGGSLWSPPSPEPGWERRPEMAPLAARAAELVDGLFDGGRRWGFKDPRTALTLPLWRQAVGPMDYIICVRGPAAVADSLRVGRPDLSTDEVLWLWTHTNALALRETQGERRMLLAYEEWFADPRATVRRLAAFALGDADALDGEAWERVLGAFDPTQRRQAATGAEREDVPTEARVLHTLLGRLAVADDPELEALAVTLGDAHAERLASRALAPPPAADGPAPQPLRLPVMVPAFPPEQDIALLREIADELGPWLQGPFPLSAGHAIEGAWRCDERWGALAPVVGQLDGERVLDVGANAGYDAFMLKTLGAGQVLGVEPYGFHDQAVFLERIYSTGVAFERIGWQALDPDVHGRFDVVHCGSLLLREPHVLRLLLKLREMTADGGRLVLGTVVEDGSHDGRMRFVGGVVAGDPTWWWVPDAAALRELLSVVGFELLQEVRAGDQPGAPFPCSLRYVLARAVAAPSEELLAADLPAGVLA